MGINGRNSGRDGVAGRERVAEHRSAVALGDRIDEAFGWVESPASRASFRRAIARTAAVGCLVVGGGAVIAFQAAEGGAGGDALADCFEIRVDPTHC